MPSWTEKELEDWLMQGRNLWDMIDSMDLADSRDGGIGHRQVPTDAGKIDLLVRVGNSIFVLELKAHQADGDALAQVLDYQHCVEAIANEATGFGGDVGVRPVILAPSFDRRVRAAAEEAHVRLIEVSASFSFDESAEPIFPDDHEFDESSSVFRLALDAQGFYDKKREEANQEVRNPVVRDPNVGEASIEEEALIEEAIPRERGRESST